jgi:cytochrome P450
VRSGELKVEEGTAAHRVAFQRDREGNLLDKQMAAIELINVVRPTVAISWYIVFTAMALHDHPDYRKKLLREGKIPMRRCLCMKCAGIIRLLRLWVPVYEKTSSFHGSESLP